MRNVWIAAIVVIVDQAAKMLVLSTMYRGQSVALVGEWLRLTFTENPGMAFGIELGHPGLVTLFSIAATLLILYYMIQIGSAYGPYRYSLGLVLGGALGNIIDRVLYGKLLYGEPLFLGRVVDFIHVDVWRGMVPEWVPGIGGHYMALFPIWNVADMSIVIGVIGIIVFQNRFHEAAAAAQAIGDSAAASTSTDGAGATEESATSRNHDGPGVVAASTTTDEAETTQTADESLASPRSADDAPPAPEAAEGSSADDPTKSA